MWQQDEPRKPVMPVNPVLFFNPRGKVVSVQPGSVAKISNQAGWVLLTPSELGQYRPGDYVATRDTLSVHEEVKPPAHRPEAVPAAKVTTVNLTPKPVVPSKSASVPAVKKSIK